MDKREIEQFPQKAMLPRTWTLFERWQKYAIIFDYTSRITESIVSDLSIFADLINAKKRGKAIPALGQSELEMELKYHSRLMAFAKKHMLLLQKEITQHLDEFDGLS